MNQIYFILIEKISKNILSVEIEKHFFKMHLKFLFNHLIKICIKPIFRTNYNSLRA
jgi:hypothetical protein